MPLGLRRIQTAMDEVFENAAARQDPDYISPNVPTTDLESQTASRNDKTGTAEDSPAAASSGNSTDDANKVKKVRCGEKRPTIALTPDQFSMIKSLNAVGFRKYPVYIHNHEHTHAAIVVRMDDPGYAEGHTVIKHWLDQEFDL